MRASLPCCWRAANNPSERVNNSYKVEARLSSFHMLPMLGNKQAKQARTGRILSMTLTILIIDSP